MRKKPVTNIATLDDELNLSFDTESFTEELARSGRSSPNNNYLHRTASVSSGLEMFQPPSDEYGMDQMSSSLIGLRIRHRSVSQLR